MILAIGSYTSLHIRSLGVGAHDKNAAPLGSPLEIWIRWVCGTALEPVFLASVPSDSDTGSL